MVTEDRNYFVTKLFLKIESLAETPENRGFLREDLSKNLFKMSITFFHGLNESPIM